MHPTAYARGYQRRCLFVTISFLVFSVHFFFFPCKGLCFFSVSQHSSATFSLYSILFCLCKTWIYERLKNFNLWSSVNHFIMCCLIDIHINIEEKYVADTQKKETTSTSSLTSSAWASSHLQFENFWIFIR